MAKRMIVGKPVVQVVLSEPAIDDALWKQHAVKGIWYYFDIERPDGAMVVCHLWRKNRRYRAEVTYTPAGCRYHYEAAHAGIQTAKAARAICHDLLDMLIRYRAKVLVDDAIQELRKESARIRKRRERLLEDRMVRIGAGRDSDKKT